MAALTAVAKRCDGRLGSRFTIQQVSLPKGADDQRLQLARRLTGNDGPGRDRARRGVDRRVRRSELGIPAFGGSVRPGRSRATCNTLPGPLATAKWQNKLYAVPSTTNTQLL